MNNQTFGLISIAVGICVGIYFAWAMKRQLATGKWIATSGKVLESRILDHGSSLEPYVKFSYAVRGETYIADRISPNPHVVSKPASEWSLKRSIAQYVVGKPVKVYFNPENPQEAVLKKNDSILANIIIAAVSLAFIIAGLVFLVKK
jgi:Protein of unknown function (DUF3592)